MESEAILFAASVTTIEAMKREPQREVTGLKDARTTTDHNSTSPPCGGASKVDMVAASPIFRPARSPNNHENRAKERNNGYIYARDLDSCIIAAVPHVRGA